MLPFTKNRAVTEMKKGYFVPKIERDTKVKEVRDSHFTMGNDKDIYHTTNKEFLHTYQV